MQAGAVNYCRELADKSDLMFQEHLEQVNIDRLGDVANHQTEEEEADIFNEMETCVQKKLLRVGMCRWFQYVNSMQEFLRIWTLRYLVLQWEWLLYKISRYIYRP